MDDISIRQKKQKAMVRGNHEARKPPAHPEYESVSRDPNEANEKSPEGRERACKRTRERSAKAFHENQSAEKSEQ